MGNPRPGPLRTVCAALADKAQPLLDLLVLPDLLLEGLSSLSRQRLRVPPGDQLKQRAVTGRFLFRQLLQVAQVADDRRSQLDGTGIGELVFIPEPVGLGAQQLDVEGSADDSA